MYVVLYYSTYTLTKSQCTDNSCTCSYVSTDMDVKHRSQQQELLAESGHTTTIHSIAKAIKWKQTKYNSSRDPHNLNRTQLIIEVWSLSLSIVVKCICPNTKQNINTKAATITTITTSIMLSPLESADTDINSSPNPILEGRKQTTFQSKRHIN